MSKRPVQKHLLRVLMLSLIVILMGGGVALLYELHQGSVASHASDDNVVGPPTLPASYVNEVFQRLGSPMVGTGQAVEAASRAQNIDDAFALAVWWTETNDGAAGVGLADRNPGSVRGSVGYPSAYDGYTIYPSFTAAVNYWFSMLKRVYINRGLTSVYTISHPYVGTSTSGLWAGKVVALMQKYHAETPPMPTPTPTATATVPPSIVRNAQEFWQQNVLNSQTPVPTPAQTLETKPQVAHISSVPATTAASGLNANVKQLLVLFNLVLALVVGLWAWKVNKRYASQAGLSSLLEGQIWETGQASWGIGQRKGTGQASWPATRQDMDLQFNSFTGGLGETGDLELSDLETETLTVVKPMVPAPAISETLLPLSVSMSVQSTQFPVPQTPQPARVSTEQLPSLEGSQPESAPFASPFGPGRIDQPGQTNTLPSNPLRRNRLLPSRTTVSLSLLPETVANAWGVPQPAGAGVPSASETDTDAWNQPQLVGAGAGGGRTNGLLSRYRESQTPEEQG